MMTRTLRTRSRILQPRILQPARYCTRVLTQTERAVHFHVGRPKRCEGKMTMKRKEDVPTCREDQTVSVRGQLPYYQLELLEGVSEARELRDAAAEEFRLALIMARSAGCSLRQIARAAGMSHQGVRWLLGEDPRSREDR